MYIAVTKLLFTSTCNLSHHLLHLPHSIIVTDPFSLPPLLHRLVTFTLPSPLNIYYLSGLTYASLLSASPPCRHLPVVVLCVILRWVSFIVMVTWTKLSHLRDPASSMAWHIHHAKGITHYTKYKNWSLSKCIGCSCCSWIHTSIKHHELLWQVG